MSILKKEVKKNMKNKILVICIVGMFLLTGVTSLSALGMNVGKENPPTTGRSEGIMEAKGISAPDNKISTYLDDQLDQQQTEYDSGWWFWGSAWVAQGFTPTLNTLSRVFLPFYRWGNPSNDASITLRVRSSLTGGNLATANVMASEIPVDEGIWLEFDFSDIPVTPGETYYIVCSQDKECNSENFFAWYCCCNNPYEAADAYLTGDSGSTWEIMDYPPDFPQIDFMFQTYGYEDDSIVAGFTWEYIGDYTIRFTDTSTGGGGINRMAWDFTNDGTDDSWVSPTEYKYPNCGTYSVDHWVKGNDNSEGTIIDPVTVPCDNHPPNTPSKPSGPTSGTVGVKYAYSTSTTDPDPGDQVKYGWDFDADGIVEPDHWTGFLASGTPCDVDITFNEAGTYYMSVKAEDEHGAQSAFSPSLTVVITTDNTPPTATIDSISPNPADEGVSVSFSGHGTDPDPGDTITGWNWRSSIDGQLSTAASFSSSSLSVGTHTIYFKVKDNHDAWSTEVSQTLKINPASNNPPNKPDKPNGPTTGQTGISYMYSSSGTDSDGDKIQYGWDWDGDDDIEEWTSFFNEGGTIYIHNTWTSPGIYNIKIKTYDGEYYSEWSNSLQVTIYQSLPDIVVEDIVVNPAIFEQWDTIDVKVTIKNTGAYDVAGNFEVKLLFTDIEYNSIDLRLYETVNGLKSGRSKTITKEVLWIWGDWVEIYVKADVYDIIMEDDEDNNEMKRNFIVKRPDLIVTDLWTEPGKISPGESGVKIKATIKNVGTEVADAWSDDPWHSEIYMQGEGMGVEKKHFELYDELEPGQTITVTWNLPFNWPANKKSYEICARADIYHDVMEMFDDNNEKCINKAASKNKAINTPFMQFLHNFFERYPNAFPMLQHILQLQRL